MDNLGLVIFKNGDKVLFGKAIYMDEKGYTDFPGHEQSFKKEIASSMTFKFEEFEYDKDENFYNMVRILASDGLITILNNRCRSTDPNKTLGYMPHVLTEEQKLTIKEMIDNKEFNGFIEELYEFSDEEEPIKYNSLEEYYQAKKARTR